MPMMDYFFLEEVAAPEAASVLAPEVGAELAPEAIGATEAGAGAVGTGAAASQMGLGQLATQEGVSSQLAPILSDATAVGGQGAGSAQVQAGMESAMQNAPQALANTPPAGITQVPPTVPAGAETMGPVGDVGSSVMTPQHKAYMDASQASINPGVTQGIKPLPAYGTPQLSPEALQVTGNAPATASPYGITSANPTISNPAYSLSSPGAGEGIKVGATGAGQGLNVGAGAANSLYTPVDTGPSGFDKAMNFVDKHPFLTGAGLYLGAYNMGMLNPKGMNEVPGSHYSGPLSKYKMSDNFKASEATPNVYKPSYKQYAEGGVLAVGGPTSEVSQPRNVVNPMATVGDMNSGGIAGYAEGGVARYAKGNLTDTLDFYAQLTGSKAGTAHSGKSDPGAAYAGDIYYDMDPDTRYQDALTAAQIRQAKVDKRANMQNPASDVMKRPTPMGSINLRPPGIKAPQAQSSLDPENAAHGGIMQVGGGTPSDGTPGGGTPSDGTPGGGTPSDGTPSDGDGASGEAHGGLLSVHRMAMGGMPRYNLGSYAAGGNPRLLRGPGDGMSDNIPAVIANKQPARLADGEFVVPADVVSHLGNGSTDAGAKKLHQMMTEVRRARTGNPKQGKQINPNKFMPKK